MKYKLKIILKKLIKAFFYLISPIFVILVVACYPIILIRFNFLSSERIGEIADGIEFYLLNKQENIRMPKRRYVDVFINGDVIANKTYVELLKKKVTILNNVIIFPTYKLIFILSKKIFFLKKFIIFFNDLDRSLDIKKKNIQISLNKNLIYKGDQFLESLGINNNQKIVCLIVRENNYLKKKFPNKNWEYHSYRDCKIKNYIDAINLATEKGYYVFRMGEVVNSPLILDNKKFIDYATLYRTDFLDVYLAQRCEFCISSGTGWTALASHTFKKPTVWTNAVPIGDPMLRSNNLIYSIKLHFNNLEKRFLSLKEIFNSSLVFSYASEEFKNNHISLIENNNQDIKNMTLEMIEKLNGLNNYSKEDKDHQERLKYIYQKYFVIPNNNYKNFEPRMSKDFIIKNKFLLDV